MSLSSSQTQASGNSLTFLEHQTRLYTQLLDALPVNLRFTPEIERDYQKDLSNTFIQENTRMLFMGILCYAGFAILDYIVYPEGFVPTTVLRVFVICVQLFILFLGFKKKLRLHILDVTTIAMVLTGLQIVIGSSFYDSPSNLAYITGILPLFVYMFSILRYSYVHTTFSCVILLFAYTVAVISYDWHMPNIPELTKYINQVAPAYIVFVSTISVIGIFLTYSVERVHRRNWLSDQINKMESKQLNYLTHELQQLTVTDSLTGLRNRRFFDQQLHHHWDACAKARLPLALVMIDVDCFKTYNDNYGHQKGDDCLKQIASLMKHECDIQDAILTRYGGEEFFILMPNATQVIAARFAELLRNEVYNSNMLHEYSPFNRCTISLGVGAITPEKDAPETKKGKDIAQLLKAIDDALYAAKEKGRNQMVEV